MSCARSAPARVCCDGRRRGVSRVFGLDVHRDFAEVAVVEDGLLRRVGRIGTSPEQLGAFAAGLLPSDRLALEATINTFAIARLLERSGAQVVISNPMKTRAIAEAKVKTDKVDAAVLAQLLAADFLPAVWRPTRRATRRPRRGRGPGRVW